MLIRHCVVPVSVAAVSDGGLRTPRGNRGLQATESGVGGQRAPPPQPTLSLTEDTSHPPRDSCPRKSVPRRSWACGFEVTKPTWNGRHRAAVTPSPHWWCSVRAGTTCSCSWLPDPTTRAPPAVTLQGSLFSRSRSPLVLWKPVGVYCSEGEGQLFHTHSDGTAR